MRMVPRRDGFALLATLWLVVAIGVVGLEWGHRARDQRRVALNTVDAAAARAAAESGIAEAFAALDEAHRRAQDPAARAPGWLRLDPWREPSRLVPDSVRTERGTRWRIELEDAGTRLDLNSVSVEGLRALLIALRVDAGQADRVAQAVADWRDPDDLRRARGAERDWYVRAGRLVLPRNGPFTRVGELRHVRAVTEEVYERAAPLLTVNGTRRVNVMAAPRPVLLALPGLGEEAVAVLERYRREGRRPPTLAAIGANLSPAARALFDANLERLARVASIETEEVRIRSEGFREGGPVRVVADALVSRRGRAVRLIRLDVSP